jgi:hypothetical protein
MKICDCGKNLAEYVEEVLDVKVSRCTPLIGIRDIIDGELVFEYDYDNATEEDCDSEVVMYQCAFCGRMITSEEMLTIFAKDVDKMGV